MALIDPTGLSASASPAEVPKSKERAQSLQDTFLNHVRKNKVPLTVFLVNGVKLQGVLTWFDSFSLLLKRGTESQLIYKHAISTIMPMAPIQLYGDDVEAETPSPAPRRPVVQIRPRGEPRPDEPSA